MNDILYGEEIDPKESIPLKFKRQEDQKLREKELEIREKIEEVRIDGT